MLSTIHRRNILAFLEKEKQASLTELKKNFVDVGDMNQTTLYRILERFKSEGIIHEVEGKQGRVFIKCCQSHADEGVKISECLSCHTFWESHFPLPVDTVEATIVEKIKYCTHCA